MICTDANLGVLRQDSRAHFHNLNRRSAFLWSRFLETYGPNNSQRQLLVEASNLNGRFAFTPPNPQHLKETLFYNRQHGRVSIQRIQDIRISLFNHSNEL